MNRGCLLLMAAVALSGCEGRIGGRGDDPGQKNGPPVCGRTVCGATGELSASTAFPRLTHAQWENTVQDLLELDAPPQLSGAFEPDTRISFFDNNAQALRVSSDLWGQYQGAAETLAEQVTRSSAALQRLLPSNLPSDQSGAARAFVASFGRRAYRRPLSNEEVDRHLTLFNEGPSHFPGMSSFDAGVRLVVEAMLQSPHFVYRVELGAENVGDRVELDDFELASRLSYMIWNSMPDDALLDAAEAGALSASQEIAAQARRMLDDPRGRAMVDRFHAQLYNWSLYSGLSKDPGEFPMTYPGIGDDMLEEARMFVEHVVLQTDGNLAELLTAPYTFVNDGLAAVYRLPGSFGGSFEQASFNPGEGRAGILSQLGFLASHGGLTGPIHRGVFINHRVLCSKLPPPPDALPPIPADDGDSMTSRQRIELHTGPGTCGSTCHGDFINPVGFAFESFDGLGQHRSTENGFPIDAQSSFLFSDGMVSYDGADEFAQVASERIETHDCYSKHWVEYALGRETAGADLDLIQSMGDASLDGVPIRELIVQVVQSEEFRSRNTEDS
jgi:hypothetical protein